MRINKIKLNKKGNITIMEIVNILVFILVFAVLVNLIIISTQYLHLSSLGNEVARTVAVQSGLRNSTPSNYPGGNSGYYTSGEIISFLNANMEASRFTKYRLKINGQIMNASKSVSVDYKDKINIELAGQYKWIALDGFIPGLSEKEFHVVVRKTVYAEYRH